LRYLLEFPQDSLLLGILFSLAIACFIAPIATILNEIAIRLGPKKLVARRDKRVKVFTERRFAPVYDILRGVQPGEKIWLCGLSLKYVFDSLRNSSSPFDKASKIYILLPQTEELCNMRDDSQNPIDVKSCTVYNDVQATLSFIKSYTKTHGEKFEVRWFGIQPYCTICQVGEKMVVGLYINMTGDNCPALYIDKQQSPYLFQKYVSHWKDLWDKSITDNNRLSSNKDISAKKLGKG